MSDFGDKYRVMVGDSNDAIFSYLSSCKNRCWSLYGVWCAPASRDESDEASSEEADIMSLPPILWAVVSRLAGGVLLVSGALKTIEAIDSTPGTVEVSSILLTAF